MPFSADALAYARRLVLAGLLDRWDAGLVRHPAERRMAVRASGQRAARLSAAGEGPAAEVAALPAVAALTSAPDTPGAASLAPGGDDDSPGELDAGDEDFYADAFEVLP